MAVDFSTKATDIDSQIEPAARLVEPVSRQGEIEAMQQIGRGLGVGARTLGVWMQNRSTMDANKRLADFSVRLSGLQDAEEQGVSPNEIRIRGRAMLQQELVNNPNAEEDILKRYSTWLGQSGYDKIETPAQQQAAINQKQIQAAVENGFISTKDINNPEKVKTAIDQLDNYNQTVRQLETDMKKISYESSQLELGSKKRSALDAQRQEVATTGLQKIGQAALPYWRTQYENIKEAAAKAGSEQERQQIIKQGIIQLQQDYAQRTAAISPETLSLDQAKIDQVLAPTKNLIDTYVKELSGEYDTETFKRTTDNILAQQELLVLNKMSDKAKALVATSKLFGQAASAVIAGPAAAEVANLFAQMESASQTERDGSPLARPGDIVNGGTEDEGGSRAYLDSVKKMLKMDSEGQLDPEAQTQLNNQLKSVFKSVDVFGNASSSAQEFQPVIDFLADPQVGAYLAGGAKLPPEFTTRAQQVIQDGYQSQVVPLLKRELGQLFLSNPILPRNADAVGSVKGQTAGEVVEPSMDSGRFGFKLKAGVQPDSLNSRLVKNMNSSPFVKVMNKMIMSNAHMQGNQDYQKSYEQLAPAIFDQTGEQEQGYVDPVVKKAGAQDTTGGELDLTDLVQQASLQGVDTSTLEGDVRDVASAIDIGESGGDYSALLGFTNRPGRKFDDVDITKMTINQLLEFADGDGPYAAYSKKQVGRVATPMGRYQIVGKTLRGLKSRLGLTGDEQFTPEMQDQLFLALLRGRGYDRYKAGEITKDEFISNLKNEWAGLRESKKSFNALVASL